MIEIKEHSHDSVEKHVKLQKQYFKAGKTRSKEFRVNMLQTLEKQIRKHEANISQALKLDLNKSETEAYVTEIGFLLEEIRFTIKHIDKWMKPKKVKTAKTHIGSKGYTIAEPYGVTLIIAPWNYPFQLQIAPLIGAIAAGNTAILKPSELTPNTSNLISSIINEVFDPAYIAVLEGGVETTTHLLDQRFDYIFFTGSVSVGKVVMEAAAKRLIPITLELGGKSPCIIDESANLELAVKRVAFGKFINAGQTCIAPDYLFVHKKVKDTFVSECKKVIHEFYGENPLENEQFAKIVNERHFNRIKSYLSHGEVLHGGNVDEKLHKIEPTLIVPKEMSSALMTEEIFGPILPIIEYEDIQEVIDFVTDRPKPLALYLFTKNDHIEKQVTETISFGGGCINDTLMHIATPYLPFGGVGESGIGDYHGESSFQTFSHMKSILKQTTLFDFSFRYPNAKNGLATLRKLMK
ncbi:aldehyde dehydrogenase (NAD+) [Metabacillus crassostreae]|uniref:aldehyde dehydrogenase n=1 Tax=Metabacillus crassostreae TaxID=929098 RepID=UPI001958E40C|nr:aldehyde dehydrogenase [Metabacillus crassostreae]MBM7605909.1 aldehyde dehydrogenase (NAD+) [Metabacillus crassostreae]